MIDGEFAMNNDRFIAAMGEAPQGALAKATFDPSSLTPEDAVVLDAH